MLVLIVSPSAIFSLVRLLMTDRRDRPGGETRAMCRSLYVGKVLRRPSMFGEGSALRVAWKFGISRSTSSTTKVWTHEGSSDILAQGTRADHVKDWDLNAR